MENKESLNCHTCTVSIHVNKRVWEQDPCRYVLPCILGIGWKMGEGVGGGGGGVGARYHFQWAG